MRTIIIATARITRTVPTQDIDLVNGNAKTSQSTCISLRIPHTPTLKLSRAASDAGISRERQPRRLQVLVKPIDAAHMF
jgi:hypothetical protein